MQKLQRYGDELALRAAVCDWNRGVNEPAPPITHLQSDEQWGLRPSLNSASLCNSESYQSCPQTSRQLSLQRLSLRFDR